jgi:hypothetical protein
MARGRDRYKRDAKGRFAKVESRGTKPKPAKASHNTKAKTAGGTKEEQQEKSHPDLDSNGNVVWNGPEVAVPNEDASLSVSGVWMSASWDDYKHSARVGAYKAQTQGYTGPKTDKLLVESAKIVAGETPDEYEPLLDLGDLEDVGAEVFAMAVHSPPTTTKTYRGVALTSEDVARLSENTSYSMPLSSFSTDRESAESYAFPAKHSWASDDARREGLVPVVFELDKGAKAASLGGELATSGEFEVRSIKPVRLKQVFGDPDNPAETGGFVVQLKQVSLLEKPSAQDLAARSQKAVEVAQNLRERFGGPVEDTIEAKEERIYTLQSMIEEGSEWGPSPEQMRRALEFAKRDFEKARRSQR